MLVMFGVGVTSVAWMLRLVVLFYRQKATARRLALSRAFGVLLLAGGGLMLLIVAPSPFSG